MEEIVSNNKCIYCFDCTYLQIINTFICWQCYTKNNVLAKQYIDQELGKGYSEGDDKKVMIDWCIVSPAVFRTFVSMLKFLYNNNSEYRNKDNFVNYQLLDTLCKQPIPNQHMRFLYISYDVTFRYSRNHPNFVVFEYYKNQDSMIAVMISIEYLNGVDPIQIFDMCTELILPGFNRVYYDEVVKFNKNNNKNRSNK